MSNEFYKVLGKNRISCNGGIGQWPYRVWTQPIDPIPCVQGYHICRLTQLLDWLGPEIWLVEYKGKFVESDNKCVVESARLIKRTSWNKHSARLFAADCAEQALPIWETIYPRDDRPRKAIEAARQFARNEITQQQVNAARYAAYSAADSAAYSAAYYAAYYAAYSAADSAAYSAADSAAYSAADSAAYYAAYSAAYYAAYSAADSAAYSAADSAAYSAADSAAYSAARSWQANQLKKYL